MTVLNTTFWSTDTKSFNELLYINSHTDEVMFSTNLKNPLETFIFFRSIAKFLNTPKLLESVRNLWREKSRDYYQFAVWHERKLVPIVWFDLVINEQITCSHDSAFSTTLIKRNNMNIPFGKFPMVYENRELPMFREQKMKRRAYTYLANQVLKYSN